MTSGYHILGAGTFDEIETKVHEINDKLGPWMWILTVVGFGLTVWDKLQVSKMVHEREGLR